MSIAEFSALISYLLIIGGLLAIILPFAPSIPTIWLGIFVYGISHDFATINENFIILVSGIALGTIILDYTLSRGGVHSLRAGPWAVLGAVIGGLAGSLVNPLFAYLIGPIIGAIVFEMLKGRDRVFSYKSGNYTIVAFMGGTFIKLLASIVMIGLFVLRLQGRY